MINDPGCQAVESKLTDFCEGREAYDHAKAMEQNAKYQKELAEAASAKSNADISQITSALKVGSRESGSSTYVTPTQLTEKQPYPGVDHLGMGYDLYYGNPNGDNKYMLDPGWRDPVRTMAFPGDWLTRDGLYKTPKGSYSIPQFSCTRTESYSNIATANQYAEACAKDVTVSAGFGGKKGHGAFQSSEGWKNAKSFETQTNFYKFESKSCETPRISNTFLECHHSLRLAGFAATAWLTRGTAAHRLPQVQVRLAL